MNIEIQIKKTDKLTVEEIKSLLFTEPETLVDKNSIKKFITGSSAFEYEFRMLCDGAFIEKISADTNMCSIDSIVKIISFVLNRNKAKVIIDSDSLSNCEIEPDDNIIEKLKIFY